MKESVAPECGPFVLLTSPSAENTNATSQRSYNNTVGIGFFLCLHFSLVYPCKKKEKKMSMYNTAQAVVSHSTSQTAPESKRTAF